MGGRWEVGSWGSAQVGVRAFAIIETSTSSMRSVRGLRFLSLYKAAFHHRLESPLASKVASHPS